MSDAAERIGDIISHPLVKGSLEIAQALLPEQYAIIAALAKAGSTYIGDRLTCERITKLLALTDLLFSHYKGQQKQIEWIIGKLEENPRGFLIRSSASKYVVDPEEDKVRVYRQVFCASIIEPATEIEKVCYFSEMLQDIRGYDIRTIKKVIAYCKQFGDEPTTGRSIRYQRKIFSEQSIIEPTDPGMEPFEGMEKPKFIEQFEQDALIQSLRRIEWLNIIRDERETDGYLSESSHRQFVITDLGQGLIDFLSHDYESKKAP